MAFIHASSLTREFKFASPVFHHALRAAIAITVAIAAAKILALSHSVWVPISVMVVMRPSLGGTLQISWKRLTGSVVGAVTSIILIYMNPSIVTVFILVSVLSFIMLYYKGKNYIIFTCSLTISVVLILGTLFSHPWQNGMERVLDTFLGISIGLGASLCIWPNFARKNLRKEMGDLIHSQHEHFKQLRAAYFNHTVKKPVLLGGRLKASEKLESCTEKFKDASIEPGLRTAQRQELVNLIDIFTRIHRTLTALSSIVSKSTGVFHGSIRPRFEDLMDAVEEQFQILETYARTGRFLTNRKKFNTTFNTFMVFVGKMRSQGNFENFTLDSRNNASAFIRQINRLGVELTRAREGIEALRKPD